MKKEKTILFCIFLFAICFKLVNSSFTKINPGDISQFFPLILQKDELEKKNDNPDILNIIYLPKGEQGLQIPNDKDVIFACPESIVSVITNQVDTFKFQNGRFDRRYRINNIECKERPKATIKINDDNPTTSRLKRPKLENDENFSIGFNIDGRFYKLISGRFDRNYGITLYTRHRIINTINTFKIVDKSSPSFSEPTFPSCEKSYEYKEQVHHISSLFSQSIRKTVEGYFQQQKQYLARGHLAPNADFIFPYLKAATFYYINSVPQWQQINNGNWKILEKDIRDMAGRHPNHVDVYTGTVGISKIFNTELFLSNKKLPIPKFTWKVVVDPVVKKAIAFVMSNNPYDSKESSSFSCTNSRHRIINQKHINIANTDCTVAFTKGCLYCCEVNDVLKQSIPHLPQHLIGYQLLTNF